MGKWVFNRRGFLLGSVVVATALSLPALAESSLRRVNTDELDVGYFESGPETGRPVILLHGAGDEVYASVAPQLAALGFRVIVPYLRGQGSTRVLDQNAPEAVPGQEVLDLMNALHIPEAVLVGVDTGVAGAAAALRPSRCVALVSLNGPPLPGLAGVLASLAGMGKWRT